MFLWGLIGIITARTLTVADRGVYATTVIVIGVVSSILGFASASTYLVANQKKSPADVAWHGLLLSIAAGLLVVGLCVSASPFASEEMRPLLLFGSLCILFATLIAELEAIGPFSVGHIPREMNSRADALANAEVDGRPVPNVPPVVP